MGKSGPYWDPKAQSPGHALPLIPVHLCICDHAHSHYIILTVSFSSGISQSGFIVTVSFLPPQWGGLWQPHLNVPILSSVTASICFHWALFPHWHISFMFTSSLHITLSAPRWEGSHIFLHCYLPRAQHSALVQSRYSIFDGLFNDGTYLWSKFYSLGQCIPHKAKCTMWAPQSLKLPDWSQIYFTITSSSWPHS